MANVVTNAGKAIISGRMFGATPSQAEPKYIGWGTGAGTAAATDTTLSTESAESRTAGTSSQVTVTTTNDTHQVTGTITATATRAITNAGILDASSTGNLYVHSDFTTVNLSTGDSIAFTFKITFS